ncbi:UNVERIFIED_CONTAM: hypothetical protein Sradi_0264800 [Sesamum radiatum]|uniref:Uncharacterized protein n=1 Tax=Sesamum radiatum TaxID=300843 RepID=A0AAW2W2W7_SESRA
MRLGRNLRTRRRILDGKGHPRPASALRRPLAPATPVSCPTVHSVHRRPTPMPWPFYVPRPSRTASQIRGPIDVPMSRNDPTRHAQGAFLPSDTAS